MTREVRVVCPCCQARLDVDVRTQTVVRWKEPGAAPEGERPAPADFDSLSERVAGRLGGAVDKFDENLAREKRRTQDLDDLFRRANEKLREGDDEPES